jgi:hypothetical protein
MQNLPFTQLPLPELTAAAAKLNAAGQLHLYYGGLTYLDVSDEYIHELFPLLGDSQISKPDYFGRRSIGAHITVIYPEEQTIPDKEELNQAHSFQITGIYTAVLGIKKYYMLGVAAPSLLALRKRYGLADKLCFRKHLVDLHITIGVQVLA